MNSREQKIHARSYKIPRIQFSEKKNLTSYAGLVVVQALFERIKLKQELDKCFSHLAGDFGHRAVVMLLLVHLMIGYRRFREVDYYKDDPLIPRVLGLRKVPSVSTISRTLSGTDEQAIANMRATVRSGVIKRLESESFPRVTMDYDGSVQWNRGHAEGSAVGFNKTKKGARGYYPLFCTIAGTDQFFDMHHRPGNVHDSNGALEFMDDCYGAMRRALPAVQLESRVDSAFFNDDVLWLMDAYDVRWTVSVPFERFPVLKGIIEQRQRWHRIDDTWSYFECDWKPQCWDERYRVVCVRRRKKIQQKGPLQLDLFIPKSYDYDYKVIMTNKVESAKHVILFHNGRGSQENILGEGKQHAGVGIIAGRTKLGNQLFTLSGMLAHNLSRELQMATRPPDRNTDAKRAPRWIFKSLGTIRQNILHRAGSLTNPAGQLTLTLNANDTVEAELMHMLNRLRE